MIEEKDVLNISFYEYKVAFTGSFKGMRYRIARRGQSLNSVFGKSLIVMTIQQKKRLKTVFLNTPMRVLKESLSI